jgi:hypothetical protein
MNKQLLQSAVVTGLNLLSDPKVRVPAHQADGVAALRALLTAIANGQLTVQEEQQPAAAAAAAAAVSPPAQPAKSNGAQAVP